jgi:hypothetical protein
MSEEIDYIKKSNFKRATRYLQEKLSVQFGEKIALSKAQEALSRAQGFEDYHHYTNYATMFESQEFEERAEYANGDIAKEINSLKHMLDMCDQHSSGAFDFLRGVLLHLYNSRWPCPPLYKAKNLDRNNQIHFLNIMALDSRAGREIHTWIEGSQDKYFRKWASAAVREDSFAASGLSDLINKRPFKVDRWTRDRSLQVETKTELIEKIRESINYIYQEIKTDYELAIQFEDDGDMAFARIRERENGWEYDIQYRYFQDDDYFVCEEVWVEWID